MTPNTRRNAPCPCGSGKRYKNCHGALTDAAEEPHRAGHAKSAAVGQADPAERFERALQLHQEGRLAPAEALYKEILEETPDQFDALNMLGVLQAQQGQHEEAIRFLKRAVDIDPGSEEANLNLGAVLFESGRTEESLLYFDKTIAINPDCAQALSNRGCALGKLHRHVEALESFDKAISITPEDVELVGNRGISLSQLGREKESLECFDKLLTANPAHVAALVNKSDVLNKLLRYSEALAVADTALAIDPNLAGAFNNRGIALLALGRLDDALASYDLALRIQPDDAETLYNRGNALRELGRIDDALVSYDRALSTRPDHADALNNRGLVLRDAERPEEALASYDRALAIRPGYAEALNNRGNALRDLNRPEDALASYESALAIRPDYAEALINRGNALRDLNRPEDALASYESALAINAEDADAHLNEALCRLLMGDFAGGWKKYEWRRRTRRFRNKREFRIALWTGDPVAGTLLAAGEQGLGDQILQASMLEELRARAAHLVVEVEPRLVGLFKRSFQGIEFVPQREKPYTGPADRQVPLGSIGNYFRRSWLDFPARKSGYLAADEKRAANLRKRLIDDGRWLVGLSWISKVKYAGRHKSINLRDLGPILELPGIKFADLQYGDTGEERGEVRKLTGIGVEHLDDIDNYQDIDGLAALVSACDAVVTVSNTTAHIAGALGKRVYLLLPYSQGTHWYWHINRDDSPWYPTARLFRQPAIGDWKTVVARVAAHLKHEVLRCGADNSENCQLESPRERPTLNGG